MLTPPFTVVLIVPTGIGAKIGGYAGDALPIARSIAQISDHLITHPNVLNGAQLYWSLPNMYYVEGYGLDQFAANRWGLRPVHQNRVGLILDQGIEPDLRLRHLQAAEAVKTTLGLNIGDYIVTDTPLGVQLQTAHSGASWGTIAHPDSLLRAAATLIETAKVSAIAVVARFPDDMATETLANYRQGKGVDALAGAEAIISHLIVREFQIPCAHAPALSPLPVDETVSPRAAAEELGYTFLPCVLVGLSRAPQLITSIDQSTDLQGKQVDAVVIPADACGGSSILNFSQSEAKIIAVEDNATTMTVSPESLGIKTIRVTSYLEALGVLVTLRGGINPDALRVSASSISRWGEGHETQH
ncbi:DUF3326 domain-containing protein [Dactylococcopsis salina]|uniref:DUF3326 domain-containing protein n=1 Tax=Dactylococcopsis salina (strain PCC 8305) TaxID=13035 RepID=K9YW64_DACS8|nr:DUF3326 domain-containing protein [Dactylococcopsis salina]AFZ51139.1 Protein of unknown function (DUF3326) [Dactylococcopsis salina PCC 8305]